MNEIQKDFLDAILNSEREAANNLVDTWAKEHSYHEAIISIVEPALKTMGELWVTTENISYAQAFVSAKIAEDVFLKSLNEVDYSENTISKGKIVIGNIEDDCHAIGRNLVTVFLRAAGWEVIDLGNDVLASEFVDQAIAVDAKIIAASAMMYTTALNIKKLRAEIDHRGLAGKIMLVVGGAVFNIRSELALEVGADGYSRNAIEAPIIIERLLLQMLTTGGE
jgi:methylmalonyl-CoA mutase cobalamin-binding domain/chain